MKENSHINKEDLYKLKSNNLNTLDKTKQLEHISSCDYCLNRYMDVINEDLIVAPSYMKENITKATKGPYQRVLKTGKEKTRQMQLFIYSLKVATATLGALTALLIFTTFSNSPFISNKPINKPPQITNKTSLSTQLRENVDSVNDFLINFSNIIIKTEDYQYDQKEK